VPERRLWLYGSVAASAGTCGLYRTARTEPMGERLRLLFNGDPVLTPVRGNKQDPAGWYLDISGPWNPDETYIRGVHQGKNANKEPGMYLGIQ
jgi:hypothetical protein